MNSCKIAIVVYKKEDLKYEKCIESINNLIIPHGVHFDIVTIEAETYGGMAHNRIMQQINAKYKIYINESIRFVNERFLFEIIEIFKDREIGAIGMLGAQSVHLSGEWWKSNRRCGVVYSQENNQIQEIRLTSSNDLLEEVRIVDDAFLATQYDLPWQDEFKTNYFSVMSYCREFELAGYKVVVPNPKKPWCIYLQLDAITKEMQGEKDIFLKKYYSYLYNKHEQHGIDYALYNFGKNVDLREGYRFACPEGICIGERTSIQKDAWMLLPYNNFDGEPRIIIGAGCDIGYRCSISAANSVILEKNVIIAANVHITDHNHEYKEIGIPIMQQGISSFTNQVVIGRGSWLANNVVIAGNVRIGKGCVIAANSVVTHDIPDYCVAAGAPARVVKMFDVKTGKWVSIHDNQELKKQLLIRKCTKPLLTVGLFTYNRSGFLDELLDKILQQVGNDKLLEILVLDNASTDNTTDIVEKYQRKYSNLQYYRNKENIGTQNNLFKIWELAKGEYVIAGGGDDCFLNVSLYRLVNSIYRNRNCSLFMLCNSDMDSYKYCCGTGAIEYLKKVSFLTTFFTGLVIKKSIYDEIKDKNKYNDTNIAHVYIQYKILENEPSFCLVKGKLFLGTSEQYRLEGYNFMEAFLNSYFRILEDNIVIPEETIREEKLKVLEQMVFPWYEKNITKAKKIPLSTLMSFYDRYYHDEIYYNEYRQRLRKILERNNALVK